MNKITILIPPYFHNIYFIIIVMFSFSPTVVISEEHRIFSECKQGNISFSRSLNGKLMDYSKYGCIGLTFLDGEKEYLDSITDEDIEDRKDSIEIWKLSIQEISIEKDNVKSISISLVNTFLEETPNMVKSWKGYPGVFGAIEEYQRAKEDLRKAKEDNDVNVRDATGKTKLIRLGFKNKPKEIVILINMGADINAQDNKGQTALMAASYKGNANIVKILLENGANPLLETEKSNYTSIIYAAENGHIEVLNLLEQFVDHDRFYKEIIKALDNLMKNIQITTIINKLGKGVGTEEDKKVIENFNMLKTHYCPNSDLKKLKSCNYQA